ncbi:Protein PHO-10 [Aphelenchoides avenae]|nr:Protein PHO-10 [Aphelenchus avenae]
MIDRFVQKRACAEKCLAEQGPCTCYPAKLKYYLYSTHLSMIIGLLSSVGNDKLNVDRDILPPDASCLFFELWRRSAGTYYIKVLYRRNGELLDLTSKVPGCGGAKCEFETFLQRSEKYRPLPTVDSLCSKTTSV